MFRLTNIRIGIDEALDEHSERAALRKKILSRLRIRDEQLKNFTIFKRSIDARKKDAIVYVYTVNLELVNGKRIYAKSTSKGLTPIPEEIHKPVQTGTERMTERPIVIGTGPAGLFAGLMLARNGYRPILLERGEDVDTRTTKVNRF